MKKDCKLVLANMLGVLVVKIERLSQAYGILSKPYKSIHTGTIFVYQDELFVATSETDKNSDLFYSLRLVDGELTTFPDDMVFEVLTQNEVIQIRNE